MNEKVMRPGEVAGLMGVSRRAAHEWIKAGLFGEPVVTPGGERRVRESQVASVMQRLGFTAKEAVHNG